VSRKISIDTLRGIACILLVSFHAAVIMIWPRLPETHALSWVNGLFGVLRMPLFAFLSGLVYAQRPYAGDAARFMGGKARRLLLPMLIVGTVFAVAEASILGAHYDWTLLHIIPVAQFWFLESMFLLFGLIVLLEGSGMLRDGWHFLLTLVGAALLYLTSILPDHLGLQGVAFLLPFFLLGVGCHRFSALLARPEPPLAAAVVMISMYAYFLARGHAMPDRHTVAALVMGASGCTLLLWANIKSRALAWIGRHSFAIFLFHIAAVEVARLSLKLAGVTDPWVLYAVCFPAGLFVPVALAAILRRAPLGHYVLGERPAAPAAVDCEPKRLMEHD